jgi:hypothetical protein
MQTVLLFLVNLRCFKGRQIAPPPEKNKENEEKVDFNDLSNWNHISNLDLHKCRDHILVESGKDVISFVFQQQSAMK